MLDGRFTRAGDPGQVEVLIRFFDQFQMPGRFPDNEFPVGKIHRKYQIQFIGKRHGSVFFGSVFLIVQGLGLLFIELSFRIHNLHPGGHQSLRVGREIDRFFAELGKAIHKDRIYATRGRPQFEPLIAGLQSQRGPDPDQMNFHPAGKTGSGRQSHEVLGEGPLLELLRPWRGGQGPGAVRVALSAVVDPTLLLRFQSLKIIFEIVEETHLLMLAAGCAWDSGFFAAISIGPVV
jgi:hypothetical protein